MATRGPRPGRAGADPVAPAARGATAAGAIGRADVVRDDAALDRGVAAARAEFLRDRPITRLDVTVLVRQDDGHWRRGSYQPEALAYPASCVKLPFLVAAMHWCRTQGQPPEALEACVGPMVRASDNVQTGVVIDTLTGTTNLPDLTTAADPRFAPWLAARGYVERLFEEHGLLQGQTLLHKTYPTNSGEMPVGAEKVAREVRGMNRMSPGAAAELLRRIVVGTLEPAARTTMLSLLRHPLRGPGSVLGFGLPVGSLYRNKTGLAYDTLEDIAAITLPNRRELIVAAFSNAFCPPYSLLPAPEHASALGPFMAGLLRHLGFDAGSPSAGGAGAPRAGVPG